MRPARRPRRYAARAEEVVSSATVGLTRAIASPLRSPAAARAYSTIASRPKACACTASRPGAPMDNAAIAHVLREIADLLEIKDDNPFKIRAYRNGADIVSNHPHELGTLDESGLREIPGIG